MKEDIKRGLAALAATFVMLAALVLPTSAVTINDASAWWSNLSFPLLTGETLGDVENVHVFLGMEGYNDGVNATGALSSNGAFLAMHHGGNGKYISVLHDSVAVFVYDSAEGWENITGERLRLYSASSTDDFSGAFYYNEIAQTEMTYGTYFAAYSAAKRYSITKLNNPFAIRWTGVTTDGATADMIYYGVPFDNVDSDGSSNPCVNYLGPFTHPRDMFNTAYGVGSADQKAYDQSAYDAIIAQMNEKIAAAYTKGYTDAAETGVKINTDDPWNVVVSFFSALFIGVRNLVSPIFVVEIAGIPVVTILGVLVTLVAVAVAIAVIIKVKG